MRVHYSTWMHQITAYFKLSSVINGINIVKIHRVQQSPHCSTISRYWHFQCLVHCSWKSVYWSCEKQVFNTSSQIFVRERKNDRTFMLLTFRAENLIWSQFKRFRTMMDETSTDVRTLCKQFFCTIWKGSTAIHEAMRIIETRFIHIAPSRTPELSTYVLDK